MLAHPRGSELRREHREAEPCMEAATDCDHIWPTKRPTGRERDDELQALCRHHHSVKTQVYDRGVARR